MALRYSPLLATVVLCVLVTVGGGATGFFIPNAQLPRDSLVAEGALPVLAIGAFSLIAGYLCGREPGYVLGGAVAGAVTMLVGFGTFLLVFGLFDRHFIGIGGRGLIPYLPIMLLIGFGLGAVAGLLRQRTVVRKR